MGFADEVALTLATTAWAVAVIANEPEVEDAGEWRVRLAELIEILQIDSHAAHANPECDAG